MTAPRFQRTAQQNASASDPFNCTFAIRNPSVSAQFGKASAAELDEWPLTLCGSIFTKTGVISEMDTLESDSYHVGSIVMNTTTGFGDLNNTRHFLNITSQESRGEWLILQTNDIRLSFTLTLCFSNVRTQDVSIKDWRSTGGSVEAVLAGTKKSRPLTLLPHVTSSVQLVFQDVLKDTKSPALVLQPFFTTLIGMSYYDFIIQFDAEAPGTIVSDTLVLQPIRRKYFIIFLVATTIHLMLVALVTVLFVMGSRYSIIGSAWSAIAQVRCPETEIWIEKAEKKNDRDLEKILNATGWGDILVSVGSAGYRTRLISTKAGDDTDYVLYNLLKGNCWGSYY
ncbi:hypothetical protein BGZ60DRAFT_532564 [Tricladium varicosporioides]|nr:hypothetical protein BGZ60DRAFT_532564 [Hymenoscyphus varicosporioides]